MNEETIWKGCSSQWLNLWPYTGTFILAAAIVTAGFFFPLALVALVIPLALAVWIYLSIRTRYYELTGERLRITHGVINQTIEEIELYRVKDSQMYRTWWMRLAGLASIKLETSDRNLPKLVIPAVRDGVELREKLRQQVEIMRDKKRVRELEFDETSADDIVE